MVDIEGHRDVVSETGSRGDLVQAERGPTEHRARTRGRHRQPGDEHQLIAGASGPYPFCRDIVELRQCPGEIGAGVVGIPVEAGHRSGDGLGDFGKRTLRAFV